MKTQIMRSALSLGAALALTTSVAAAPPVRGKPKAPSPAPVSTPAGPDAMQSMLDGGILQSAYNPVLLSFLTDEARGGLPEAQRKAALDQLVTGFKAQIQIKPGAMGAAGIATALGAVLGGTAGKGISEGADQVWSDWVAAAMVLQRAGYKDETTPFFQNCLETFPNDDLRASCATGLAANDPDKALSILLGLMDNKYPEEVQQAGLRLIGDIAAAEGLPKEKKDAAVDELVKRSKGLMNTSLFPAAIEGLRRAKDPRAVEPLRGLTKGLKGDDVKLAALRALLLGYDDAGARESLQKKLKGGFMVEEKDRVPAVLVLIEAGDPVGLDWALQYLTKKKKKDPDLSPEVVDALVARGDEPARGVLAKALPAQTATDWIAADMAIGLLQLGDASGLEIVRSALANKNWPNTRIQAAVVLARQQKDYSGVPVLKAMTESDSLLKAALKLAIGKAFDIESMRSAVAAALGRIDNADCVPLLVGLLGDRSERVRLSAAYALARMTDAAALDGLDRALDVDYGREGSRSRNPEVRAHLLRVAAARFPGDTRTAALLKKGRASDAASVRFLALAETKVVSR